MFAKYLENEVVMKLEDLIELYILQKEHHENKGDSGFQEDYDSKFASLMSDIPFSREYIMANTTVNQEQPEIPFVLFKPNNINPENPAPLIIHTHGGPQVYFDKNYNHAEIAYFLSKGYVVACPNYRGSTDYPSSDVDKRNEWFNWKEKSKNKYHIYGPEDVHAVTMFMLEKQYIDKTKVFLRGGSFGSFINAHLLAQVKAGKYKNVYKGVHFSGGTNYPSELVIPEDMPILITHGAKDDIAPPEDAKLFMEQLLLNQLAVKKNNPDFTFNVQSFFSSTGNHHLIDAGLTTGSDKESKNYQELMRYLELTTSFIESIARNELFITEQPSVQLCALNNDYNNTDKLGLDILSFYSARAQYLETSEIKTYGPTMALLKTSVRPKQ